MRKIAKISPSAKRLLITLKHLLKEPVIPTKIDNLYHFVALKQIEKLLEKINEQNITVPKRLATLIENRARVKQPK